LTQGAFSGYYNYRTIQYQSAPNISENIMLVIISGLPGTGKTSVAKVLSQHLNAERLTTDELRRRIDKHPDYSQKHKRSVYAALMEEAGKRLQHNKNVILDGTFFKQDMRRRAKELSREYHESFYLIKVTCPEKIVKQRIENRYKKGEDASEADFKVYKIIQNQFQEIKDLNFVIDTSEEKEWKEKILDIANRIRVKTRHHEMIEPLLKKDHQLFQTHMSWVILDGTYARKIKKPVKYSFADYSTKGKRKRFCHRENNLNSLISPEIYLSVESIVKRDNKIEFGNNGEVLDYCVKMKELPQEDRMDHRLKKNQVSTEDIKEIARILFDFHNHSHAAEKQYGTVQAIQNNFKPAFEMQEFIEEEMGQGKQIKSIQKYVKTFSNHHQDLFPKRIEQEKIRHGHGDVRSKNIFITKNKIYLFDAIEFSEKIACCDVAADLAYLAMDLNFYGHKDLAFRLINHYVSLSDDSDMLKLIDFYQCYRAMVQVLVQAYIIQDEDVSPEQKHKARDLCQQYLSLAEDFSSKK